MPNFFLSGGISLKIRAADTRGVVVRLAGRRSTAPNHVSGESLDRLKQEEPRRFRRGSFLFHVRARALTCLTFGLAPSPV
jgi:hypothetical protein